MSVAADAVRRQADKPFAAHETWWQSMAITLADEAMVLEDEIESLRREVSKLENER